MIKKIIFAFAVFTCIYFPINFFFGLLLELLYKLIPNLFNILIFIKKYGQILIKLLSALITYRFAIMVHEGK